MQKNYNPPGLFPQPGEKRKGPLTIFLMNGVQMKGQVRGFDNFIVIIESDGKRQMVYKCHFYHHTPPAHRHVHADQAGRRGRRIGEHQEKRRNFE